MKASNVTAMISLAFALLGAAVVYGTDVFFRVVGRTALTRVSDATLVETMGRFHEVADRRMPIFGVIGIVGALASVAFSRVSWPWALSAVAAQILWIVVYRRVAAPVNAELTRQARAGSVPTNARALQARWDSVIVARVLLMGFAVIALAAKGGPWNTTVIIRWSAVQDLPDGSPYNNHGVHIIRMCWGKVFDIDANEDSQLVAASLQIWAAHGVTEALADPILS